MRRILALLLCICLGASLFGCAEEELKDPGMFYYYRTDTAYSGTDGVIAPEERELAGIRDDLDALLECYCQGPERPELENPLPQGTGAPSWTLRDGVLTLDFASGFAALSGIELTVAAGCLARTFLELTGAETLVLTAGGALLDGETALTLTKDTMLLRDDSLDLLHGEFTVYYTDADRRYLIGQSVSLNLSSREELPILLLEQMLDAPSGTALRAVIPEGTRIRSVTVEDGLCSVDLSAGFESRRFYSHTSQLLSLLGIVNCLTALGEIDQVEFSVEGSLLVRYGSLSISGPMSADSRLIGPVRTGLGERDATIYLTQGSGLIAIPTRLRQTGAVSQPELVLRTLLSDPGTNGFTTCIPAGAKLNSIRVEKRICHVDLSAEYLDSPEDLVWAGRVITASLCELDSISAVRITVDGAVPEGFDSAIFGVLTPENDWFL